MVCDHFFCKGTRALRELCPAVSGFEEPAGTLPESVKTPDGGCATACAPLLECPSWSFPTITADCFTCIHVTSTLEHLPIQFPLGAGEQAGECETGGVDPGEVLVIEWLETEIDISDPDDTYGAMYLYWTDENGEPLCGFSYVADHMDRHFWAARPF